MVDILDIAPVMTKVKYRGEELSVPGLSIEGIVHLLVRYPEVSSIFQGKKMDTEMSDILKLGINFVADFLAAGLGHTDDEKVIKICRAMKPEEVFDIGEAIIKDSFPGGAANFMVRVQTAMSSIGIQESAELQRMKAEILNPEAPTS